MNPELVEILEEPWGRDPVSGPATRRMVALDSSGITDARCRMLGHDALPTSLHDARDRVLWELPVSHPSDAAGEVFVEVTARGWSQPMRLRIPVNPETQTSTDAAELLIDHHVEQLRPWLDGELDGTARAEGLFIGPWSLLLSHYVATQAAEKEPPMHLIVKIARECRNLVEGLCQRPRRILRRERRMLAASKVQDIDDACLRWLARQPGRTLAQRAGPRQIVLAVVRADSVDTPENRVLRDFLELSIHASERYLRQFRDFAESERVLAVDLYCRLARRLLQHSAVSSVPRLVGTAEANYALQFDDRYASLWNWYRRLKRQENEVDDLSAWRHRTWAERVLLLTAAECERLSQPTGSFRGDAWLRSESDHGCFVDARSMPGPWSIPNSDPDELMRIVPRHEIERHPCELVRGMGRYGVDFALVIGGAHDQSMVVRALAVACVFAPDDDAVAFLRRVNSFSRALDHSRGSFALLVEPSQPSCPELQTDLGGGVTGVRLPLAQSQTEPSGVAALRSALTTFATGERA